jgi:hypothetical protein
MFNDVGTLLMILMATFLPWTTWVPTLTNPEKEQSHVSHSLLGIMHGSTQVFWNLNELNY